MATCWVLKVEWREHKRNWTFDVPVQDVPALQAPDMLWQFDVVPAHLVCKASVVVGLEVFKVRWLAWRFY